MTTFDREKNNSEKMNPAKNKNSSGSGRRNYDLPTPQGLSEFMRSGWASSPLENLAPAESNSFTYQRRQKLGNLYPGQRLVIPSGPEQIRSNDSDFPFRPNSDFIFFTGITAEDALPNSVLILEPNSATQGVTHDAYLYIPPRQSRDTEEFYRDSRDGEFWVGRRMTLAETATKYGVATRDINMFSEILNQEVDTLVLRGVDPKIDALFDKRRKKEEDFAVTLSEMRLIKDSFEEAQLQLAVDISIRGFADMVRSFPAATSRTKGERIIEAAFFGRARLEGNALGYNSIVASGSHACILHWTKNSGDVMPGDLILLDAGVEVDTFYTADVTRTIPISGTFSPAQKEIYTLVYEAQAAAFAQIKPGANFLDGAKAAAKVLAEGLERLGILPIPAAESLKPESGLHKRWTVHGVSHMLGIDVHDCAHARNENYRDSEIKEGMVFTVEPGLYFHQDDLLVPEKYRGIGVRIEDDIIVTKDGYRNLTAKLPSHPDEVEVWASSLLRH
jgi:Xaa-Pro aminopeptidase